MINAVAEDDYEKTKYLLEQGAAPNIGGAIKDAKNLEMIKLLVSYGSTLSSAVFEKVCNDYDAVKYLIDAGMDVNFEPNGATEADRKPCEAEISGDAKKTGDNEITIKKQIEGETKHCALKVQLTTDGAKVEQSPECGYFVAGICHFDSEGKELTRVK